MAKGNRYFSNKQESQIASAMGWSVVTGSGARHLYPGDVQGIEWLGECKTHATIYKPIVFDLKVWDKISEEAASRHRYPVLFVDDGSQSLNRTWCMIPESIDVSELSPATPVEDYPKPIKSTVTFLNSLLDTNTIYYCVADNTTMYILHFKLFEDIFKR